MHPLTLWFSLRALCLHPPVTPYTVLHLAYTLVTASLHPPITGVLRCASTDLVVFFTYSLLTPSGYTLYSVTPCLHPGNSSIKSNQHRRGVLRCASAKRDLKNGTRPFFKNEYTFEVPQRILLVIWMKSNSGGESILALPLHTIGA